MPGDLEDETVMLIESLAGCKIERAVWDRREDEAFLFLDDGRVVRFWGFANNNDTASVIVDVVNIKQLYKRQRLLLGGS